MNTTYRCPLGLTSHTLSAWRDHLLSASERERIGVHVRACQACQRQLEAFEQLAQPLRAERVPQPDERLWGAVSAAMVRARGGRGRMGEDMSTGSIKRYWGGMAAVAAVALLALGFAELFGPLTTGRGNRTQATPTVANTTANATASATAALDNRTGLVIAGQKAWYVLSPADGTLISTVTSSDLRVCTVADDGAAFGTAADGGVVAYNLLDGSVRWHAQFPGGQVSTTCKLTTNNQVVYAPTVGNQSFALFALSTRDGHVLWHISTPYASSQPSVVGGSVYVAETDGATKQSLHAYRADNGTELWHTDFTDGPSGNLAPPTLVDSVAYFMTRHRTPSLGEVGTVHALRTSDGTELWQVAGVVPSTPLAVADGNVYVAYADDLGRLKSPLTALDARTGAQRWQSTVQTNTSGAIASGGNWFGYAVLNGWYHLVEVDSGSGHITWQTAYGSDSTVYVTQLVLAGKVIYASWYTRVIALDATTGHELWRYSGTEELEPGVLTSTAARQ